MNSLVYQKERGKNVTLSLLATSHTKLSHPIIARCHFTFNGNNRELDLLFIN